VTTEVHHTDTVADCQRVTRHDVDSLIDGAVAAEGAAGGARSERNRLGQSGGGVVVEFSYRGRRGGSDGHAAGAIDAALPDGFTGYWHGASDPYTEPGFAPGGGLNTAETSSAAAQAAALAQLGLTNINQLGVDDRSTGSSVSDAGTFVLTETSLDMHCWGQNPVVVAKLQLNGQDRFSEREGSYFSWVQPYQAHTRNPDEGINVYSFALRPEEHQPSGTCNFSRIDNATLQLVLSNATVEGTKTAKVRVYATNYNVLRIMSGMGGLAYSN